MAVNGFECLLNDPTRITADTATCIDHVFARVSRVDMMSVEADVEHAGITDHSLVRVCVGVCDEQELTNGTRSGPENRAEILGCVPSLQALEMGKNSLRPHGRHCSNDLTSF
ncbi:hypothetical protein J6590_103298 [Homalodisca vitripennis]|nr:hypothetical protein J6590_103298 [Homalodisca vitripennis]